MDKQKYFSKDISILSSTPYELTEKSKFLGEIEIDIATTHLDSGNDILSEKFIDQTVHSLSVDHKAFFLNHDVRDLPIGKVLGATKFHLPDGHKSARLRVGISKTRKDIWMLVEEGILEKGSIGYFIDEYTYDEKTDILHIESGETVEGSLVGLPMNNNASVVNFSKQLQYRKSLIDSHLDRVKLLDNKQTKQLENKDEDIDMPTIEDMEAMVTKKLAEADAMRLAAEKEKTREAELELMKQKIADFDKEKEDYVELLATKELEKVELEKQLGKGRKGGASHEDPKEDKFSFENEDYAVRASLYRLGKMMSEVKKKGHLFIELMPAGGDEEFEMLELIN